MIANLIRTAWRFVLRNKTHALLNIFGFSLGLAACILIVLSLLDDFQYDKHYKGSGELYRMYMEWRRDDGSYSNPGAPTCGALTKRLKANFPEVIAATRMQYWGARDIRRGDIPSDNTSLHIIHADSTFLDVFGYDFIAGNRNTTLTSSEAVLISESAAERLFGREDPVGKPIVIPGIDNAFVAGVAESAPKQSHLQYDIVIPLVEDDVTRFWLDNWTNYWTLGYVRLVEGTDPKEFEDKIATYFVKEASQALGEGNDWLERAHFVMMPVSKIHLHTSNHEYNWVNFNGQSIEQMRLLGAIAAAILLLASINFINLSSATAARRAKEVGLRKTIGANPASLRIQFLLESIFTTLFATLLAIGIVQMAAPFLEPVIGKDLGRMFAENPVIILFLLLAAVVVGLLSGLYPAAVLTSFRPVSVLKGDFRTSKAGRHLRRILVVFQFTISISLVVAVIVMINQFRYIQERDWGYNREQVMFFQAGEGFEANDRDAFLQRLEASSKILAAGSSNLSPGENPPWNRVYLDGPANPDSSTGFIHFDVRGGWFEALEIPFESGRTFYKDSYADVDHSVILSESAVKLLGLDNPIGAPFYWGAPDNMVHVTIIGVVKDFHFGTARDRQAPCMFHPYNGYARQVVVRLPSGGIKEGIDEVEAIYRDFFGGTPTWSFLDERFDMIYKQDQQLMKSVGIFSALAIIIACLGIFGLSSYTTDQRKREIAVRKVLGAGESTLVFLLSRSFLSWVLLSNIIAWPLAAWLMHTWLGQFEFKTSLSVLPFIIAGVIAFVVASITVGGLTIRISRMNPTDTLRQG